MIPVGDYVRDALAVLFLLTALSSAWDSQHQSAGPDYLVPVTLLSILSLALPYLSMASVLPRVLTPGRLQYVRLLANTPYLVVALTSLALGYGGGSGAAEVGAGRGVGMGVVLGLVGVVLATQGRTSEVRGSASGSMLWPAAAVLAGLGVVLSVVSAVLYIVEFTGEAGWGEAAVFVLDMIFFAGMPVLAVRGLVRGDSVWREVTIVLGAVGLLATLWAEGAGETMGDVWSLRLAGPQALLWPAIGAAAAAPGIAAVVSSPVAGMRWVNLAGRLFQVVTLVAVVAILIYGFQIVDDADARGTYLSGIVLSLVTLVLATFARNALVKDATARRPSAVGAALGLIAVTLVQMSVLGFSESVVIGIDVATILSVWFVFAAVSVVALMGPSSVTEDPSAVEDGVADESSPSAPPIDGPHIHAEDTSIWTVNPAEAGASETGASGADSSESPELGSGAGWQARPGRSQ